MAGISEENEDSAQFQKVVTKKEVHATTETTSLPAEVLSVTDEGIEEPKSLGAEPHHGNDMVTEEVVISDFKFSPVMPEVVAVAPNKGGSESTSQDVPQKLIDEVGLNLERCLLALGGVVHEAVEGGIKFSHKTKEQAAVIVAAVTAVTGVKKNWDSNTTSIVSEEGKKLDSIAEERRKLIAFLSEESKKKASFTAKRSTRTANDASLKNHGMLNRIRSNLSNICNPLKPLNDNVAKSSPSKTISVDESIHQGASIDKSNCGQISDKDFQQFLSWWSTCEKETVSSKQINARQHEDAKKSNKQLPVPAKHSGELSDELLAHFFNLCSHINAPPAATKPNFAFQGGLREPTATTSNQNNGQLSDEEFNRFISAWSTCEKQSVPSPKSKAPVLNKNDGMLNDEEFQNFLSWWSTTKRAIERLVVNRTLSETLIDSNSLSFRSVEIDSSDKQDGTVDSDASFESKIGRVELELEDGTIVISPYFSDNIEIRGDEEWDFVDAATEENEMLGRAAVTLGLSLFQEDLTRSTEALSEPTVVISNASDFVLSKTLSRVSLDSSVSLVSSESSEEGSSEMSFVSSVESVASWSSVNSTTSWE